MPSMPSLLLQSLVVLAIAVLVYEVRRWTPAGVSLAMSILRRSLSPAHLASDFGRLHARGGRPLPVPAWAPVEAPARDAPPAPPLHVPAMPSRLEVPSSPAVRGPRRPAGWLALTAAVAAIAIAAVVLLRLRPDTAHAASD